MDASSASPRALHPAWVALVVVATIVFFGALLFGPAGRLDWALGWLYLGIVASNSVVTWVCLQRWNPELIARRMRFGKGTKTWDKIWALVYAPVMIAIYVVAGLEARSEMDRLLWIEWLLGLAIFVPGSALLTWSMVVNPFFEKTVRIQLDRGHRVIDRGPYAFVRHPGYLGFLGWILSAPLLLDSRWAAIPVVLAIVGLLIRTVLEDRTLQEELPGYCEYAARVRFRLIPGIW